MKLYGVLLVVFIIAWVKCCLLQPFFDWFTPCKPLNRWMAVKCFCLHGVFFYLSSKQKYLITRMTLDSEKRNFTKAIGKYTQLWPDHEQDRNTTQGNKRGHWAKHDFYQTLENWTSGLINFRAQLTQRSNPGKTTSRPINFRALQPHR